MSPRNDGHSLDSAVCGRRNSARLALGRIPFVRQPPDSGTGLMFTPSAPIFANRQNQVDRKRPRAYNDKSSGRFAGEADKTSGMCRWAKRRRGIDAEKYGPGSKGDKSAMPDYEHIRYIELKSGYSDDGPAWIGRIKSSKTGRTVYFNGRIFRKKNGNFGNHIDTETGGAYWISAPKKRLRQTLGRTGKLSIDKKIVEAYLRYTGEKTRSWKIRER